MNDRLDGISYAEVKRDCPPKAVENPRYRPGFERWSVYNSPEDARNMGPL